MIAIAQAIVRAKIKIARIRSLTEKRIIVERDRMYERNGCDGKKWWLTLKPLDSTYEHEENANLG